MADQGGNVGQALADIARQATCLLQRYENGDAKTMENVTINPLENPTDRTARTSAVASNVLASTFFEHQSSRRSREAVIARGFSAIVGQFRETKVRFQVEARDPF